MIVASAVPELGVLVPLWEVEHELSRQMRVMHGENESPVQRVRMSNLVVYCDREDQLAPMVAKLSDVTAVHPARVLLLAGGGTGKGITASVKVEGHRLGKNEQACTELVILQAPADQVDGLPFAVRSLIVGDLPINLWW